MLQLAMATDRGLVRVRGSARSCIECRRRKIRCIWPADSGGLGVDGRTACDHCAARGRACLPQRLQRQPRHTARVSARDRLISLEKEMALLAALVRDKQAAPSPGLDPSSVAARPLDDSEDDVDPTDIPDTDPPSHLRLLFDDFAVSFEEDKADERNRSANGLYLRSIESARAKLQPLIPSKEEVTRLAGFASDWMTLYYALFPAFFAFRTGEQLTSHYEQMHDPGQHPVMLAMYLLSLAITAQQVPADSVPLTLYGGRGVPKFVDAVCRTVGKSVVGNDALVGTSRGLEMAMLFVRLSVSVQSPVLLRTNYRRMLGNGNLISTWMTVRRLITIAELLGLPKESHHEESTIVTQPTRQDNPSALQASRLKTMVWETICATDRNLSMMMNIPAGTARYTFPLNESVMRDGHISAQAYNYQLSAICGLVYEIDELYVRGAPEEERYEKVLMTDHRLRALSARAPRAWWQQDDPGSLAELLVKFWHFYITARAHLRPAMANDEDNKYEYSRTICRDACRNAVSRFCKFRSCIPSGFFVCRVLDAQAFTAATFLLMSSRLSGSNNQPANSTIDPHIIRLVRGLVECFEQVADRPGSGFAREAITAITSLESVVQGERVLTQSGPLKLRIPLLGKISITGPTNTVVNETPSVESVNVGRSDGTSKSYSANGWVSDAGLNHPTDTSLAPSAVAVPISWTFDFDNTPFLAEGSLPVDNVNPGDYQDFANPMNSWI